MMAGRFRDELTSALMWLIFPIVPVVLGDVYYQLGNLDLSGTGRMGPDPHDWGWIKWVIMLGPLVGYGFLAGATLDLPDELGPARRWWRRLFLRRGTLVAVGPWIGLLFWAVAYLVLVLASSALEMLFPARRRPELQWPLHSNETWMSRSLSLLWLVFLVATFAYGWLWLGWTVLRRAARIGCRRRVLKRGLITALAFVGSLFGSFWAMTSAWRSYFFDPRMVPLLILALGLATMCGCSSTITYGEMRRRELFHAMLVAWVLGLALMWRWWSRRRPRSG